MKLTDLETPALILDRSRLERNIARMSGHLSQLGVGLRPHVKTAKSIDVLRRVLAGQPGGITVSTLKEAEYFFSHGVRDMLYAVAIAPNKIAHVAALRERGADIIMVLDNVASAQMVVDRGVALGAEFPVMIEIDCDGHRSGIRPGDAALIDIGHILHGGRGARLHGVMTHAGDSYNCKSVDEIRAMAERERLAVVRCAQDLGRAGLPCPVVSVGSTPTATYAEKLDGVTEVRAGVYMFFDLVMAGLGVCVLDDIALSVLTTVIGHQPEKHWIITDAGWMALSRDRGTDKQIIDQGYGVVCDVDGRPLAGLIVADANQEHGIIADRNGGALDWKAYPVGSQLRILPNHACATAAAHPAYQVVNGSTDIDSVWERFSGW